MNNETGVAEELIDSDKYTSEQQEYLRNRWQHELEYFAKATRKSKEKYFRYSIIIIISTSVTAFANSANAFSDMALLKYISATLSIVAAISIGLFGLYRPWENWKNRSMVVERLRSEGRKYLANVGAYKELDPDIAFSVFSEEVENAILNYKIGYFSKAPFNPKAINIEETNNDQEPNKSLNQIGAKDAPPG